MLAENTMCNQLHSNGHFQGSLAAAIRTANISFLRRALLFLQAVDGVQVELQILRLP